jgi:hypothetical protein
MVTVDRIELARARDGDFFPTVPSISALAALGALPSTSIIQEVSSGLRAPYLMQSAGGIERQLPANTTLAITYTNSHGLHLLRSQDINAPLPGTLNPQVPGSGVFPYNRTGPIFLMESSGLYNQNQLIVNVNSKVNGNISLFGSYVLNYAMSNTDGLNTFPANPYSMAGEYGPALTDIRNRVSFGGSIKTKWNFQFNPLLMLIRASPSTSRSVRTFMETRCSTRGPASLQIPINQASFKPPTVC